MAGPERPVAVARLGRPRGLKGELFVLVYSGGAQRLEAARRLFVESAGAWRELEVAHAWEHNGKGVVRFAGVDSPEGAASLRGLELWVPESEAEAAPEGSWHQYQLLGLQVVDEKGRLRGVIEERVPGVSHGWWRVRNEDRSFLFPEVADLVESVDQKAGIAHVFWTEGLDELDAD